MGIEVGSVGVVEARVVGARRHHLVVEEHAEGGRLDIVVLPVADGPPEGEHAGAGEQQGEGDEDVEDAHGSRESNGQSAGVKERWRIDEATTTSDEIGMATAATSGVTSPAMATAAPPTL